MLTGVPPAPCYPYAGVYHGTFGHCAVVGPLFWLALDNPVDKAGRRSAQQ